MAPDEEQDGSRDITVDTRGTQQEERTAGRREQKNGGSGASTEDSGRSAGWFSRVARKKVFGTFVYAYFAAFVIFHVAVALSFLMTAMDPWVGLITWLAVTVAGGFCVVALALWRDTLRTFWD